MLTKAVKYFMSQELFKGICFTTNLCWFFKMRNYGICLDQLKIALKKKITNPQVKIISALRYNFKELCNFGSNSNFYYYKKYCI